MGGDEVARGVQALQAQKPAARAGKSSRSQPAARSARPALIHTARVDPYGLALPAAGRPRHAGAADA
ncbi:hypothetical protein GCM10010440_37380 [Kitasatospora cinereorecta]